MFLLMLAAQAANAGSVPAGPEPVAPIDFDLRTVQSAPSEDEIVVSRRRRDDQRVQPLTRFAEEKGLPRAETGLIGNVRAAVTAEQAQLPGAVSNRVMVKLRMPF